MNSESDQPMSSRLRIVEYKYCPHIRIYRYLLSQKYRVTWYATSNLVKRQIAFNGSEELSLKANWILVTAYVEVVGQNSKNISKNNSNAEPGLYKGMREYATVKINSVTFKNQVIAVLGNTLAAHVKNLFVNHLLKLEYTPSISSLLVPL